MGACGCYKCFVFVVCVRISVGHDVLLFYFDFLFMACWDSSSFSLRDAEVPASVEFKRDSIYAFAF